MTYRIRDRNVKANNEYIALLRYLNDSRGLALCKDGKGRWALQDARMITADYVYAERTYGNERDN